MKYAVNLPKNENCALMPPQPEDDEDVDELEPGFNVNISIWRAECVCCVVWSVEENTRVLEGLGTPLVVAVLYLSNYMKLQISQKG